MLSFLAPCPPARTTREIREKEGTLRCKSHNRGSSGLFSSFSLEFLFVYYEEIKRELNRRLMYEYRCDERLRAKAEGSTRLTYTGLCGGLEHLKIETRLRDERFVSVKGECVI